MLSRMTNAMDGLGRTLSAAVDKTAASVVRVSGGCRRAMSGTVWSATQIVASQRDLADSDTVSVGLADGSHVEARVVGRDPASDIALLEVANGALTPATFRDTDGVKVGELVIALGRPGRATRASMRMIGAYAEDVATEAGGTLKRYIETDRAIPDGFSGGPVVDAEGRALGIQSEALVRGADLVVPTELVREVVGELAAHGKVRAGFLGVSVSPVRLPQAATDQLSRKRGALVIAVAEGSAAEKGGLHLGDVILEVDGEKIANGRHLARALRGRFDVEVTIKVWRTGQLVELKATPGQRG